MGRPRRRWDPVVQGLVGGVVIAALNTLGAALVVIWPNPTDRVLDGALGVTVMLYLDIVLG